MEREKRRKTILRNGMKKYGLDEEVAFLVATVLEPRCDHAEPPEAFDAAVDEVAVDLGQALNDLSEDNWRAPLEERCRRHARDLAAKADAHEMDGAAERLRKAVCVSLGEMPLERVRQDITFPDMDRIVVDGHPRPVGVWR